MRRAWLALALLLLGLTVATAQSVPEGLPQPGRVLRDRDFRISTHQFGLEREVEMYQWREGEAGYERVWNSARIDSSRFAPGHENPTAMPLDSRRWLADRPTLDGRPLDPEVLSGIGEWQVFRPNFSRLPANLAVSFQPEGDGLGSSENPLAPQVGDLRVHWRELVLPALSGKVELREGTWRLATGAAIAPARLEAVKEGVEAAEIPVRDWWPWIAAAVAGLSGLLLLLLRRRRRYSSRHEEA